MAQITVLEALQNFFANLNTSHNAPELIARWTPEMETQVNVGICGGEKVKEGSRTYYSDGVDTWFNIRIPKQAASEPMWDDHPLPWPLDKYAEGIGSTGWNWKQKQSRWVGFDFDSITGHATGVGVSADNLAKIKEQASSLPFVEVRHSTGGNGLHFYVYFEDGIETANHTQHAALARSVLTMLTTETGFDFSQHVDVCGGNMWLWHRKMRVDNNGLKLIKPADRKLSLAELPTNWRDHVDVITRRRPRVQIGGVDQKTESELEKLSNGRKIVPLDDTHKALIKALGDGSSWLHDHHLLQTHTKELERVFEQKPFPIQGIFKTSSRGSTDLNCFGFPIPNGAWKIVRFSPGCSEHRTWTQDGTHWTYCFFNRPASLKTASYAFGGSFDPESNEYVFTDYGAACETVLALGDTLELPTSMRFREIRLKTATNGHLMAKIPREERDDTLPGWVNKKTKWVKGFSVQTDQPTNGDLLFDYDNMVRTVVTPTGASAGWRLHGKGGQWFIRPKDDLKDVLVYEGVDPGSIGKILGAAIHQPWTLVNVPFQPEYIGDRQWNKDAAKFTYQPAILDKDDSPHHPHWDMVLKHIGRDLDTELPKEEWAQRAKIVTGADYLTAWITSMFRYPYSPLPYLFLYGPENSGKSILHQSIESLMTSGAIQADKALASNNDFNGELANAVLCYIEERDLSKSQGMHNRMKDWVTNPNISIRKMHTDAYSQPNTSHWIQTANHPGYLPIFPGDTRITMLYVEKPAVEIPRDQMNAYLAAEAPHFMRNLLDFELPAPTGRLRIPVVSTENKKRHEELQRSPIESFIAECCVEQDGSTITFKNFYEDFHKWLPEEERGDWPRKRVSHVMPVQYPSKRGSGNRLFIERLAWRKDYD